MAIKKIIFFFIFFCLSIFGFSKKSNFTWQEYFDQFKNAKDYNKRVYYLELGIKTSKKEKNAFAYELLKSQLVKIHYKHALLHSWRFTRCKKGYDEAIVAFTKAIKIKPADYLYQKRGDLYLKKNKNENGLEDYKIAVRQNPSLSNYYKLAKVYNILEECSYAVRIYKKLIKLYPSNKKINKIYISLGRTLISMGNFRKAYKVFCQFIERYNRSRNVSECIFWKGYILAEGYGEILKGYKLVREAINKGYDTRKSRYHLNKYRKHPDIRISKSNTYNPDYKIKKNPYSFLVISDTHVYLKKNKSLPLLKKILYKKDKFILILGDITQNGRLEDYKAFKRYMNNLGLPYYPAIGNHDILNDKSHNGWLNYNKTLGASFYTFTTGKIRFICLDTAALTVGEKQLLWLKNVLKDKKEPFCVVFTHFPIFPNSEDDPVFENETEASKIFRLFSRYGVDYVINGHTHQNYCEKINGITFITLAEFTKGEKSYLRFFINKRKFTFEKYFVEP